MIMIISVHICIYSIPIHMNVVQPIQFIIGYDGKYCILFS